MPSYWYNLRDLTIHDDDDEETITAIEFNKRIAAYRKPYFMTYVYPTLKKDNKEYIKNTKAVMIIKYQVRSIDELAELGENTDNDDIRRTVEYYHKWRPTGDNPCLVNRICWLFEKEFSKFTYYISKMPTFDYSILKCGVKYSRDLYNQIKQCHIKHQERNRQLAKIMNTERVGKEYALYERLQMITLFQKECYQICSNEDVLCDIALDMCYQSEGSKQFVWDVCGPTILRRLLVRNDGMIQYPALVENNGDFQFCGRHFKMENKVIQERSYDYTE